MRVWPGNQFRIYTPRSRFDLAFRGALSPAGPSALVFILIPGENPGEIVVEVYGAPDDLGDGPVAKDDQGELTDILISIAGGAPVAYGPDIPRIVVSGGHTPGGLVSVTVQALGFESRPGTLSTGSVNAAVVPPVGFIGLVDPRTGFGLMSGGVGWVIPEPS